MSSSISILLKREKSSMVSAFDQYLGFERIDTEIWRVGSYSYEIIGSIYELVPESERYDKHGDLLIPDRVGGDKVIGLADGEYLEIDKLVSVDYVDFSKNEVAKVWDFCDSRGWSEEAEFESIKLKIRIAVEGG